MKIPSNLVPFLFLHVLIRLSHPVYTSIMKLFAFVLPLLFGATFGAQNLFTIQPSASTAGIVDCDGDAVLTCQKISVRMKNNIFRYQAWHVLLSVC